MKSHILLTFTVLLITVGVKAKVRWNYDVPPKIFKSIFENKNYQFVEDQIKTSTFINTQGNFQVTPIGYYEYVKWLNRGLINLKEVPFDSKKSRLFLQRDKEDPKKINGRYIRQANRIFCFPCIFKKRGRVVFGEISRKEVFLVETGVPAIVLAQKVIKKVVRKRKPYTDKAKQFEIKIMKGEYPIKSQRNEDGDLYHSLNCFYQLRLHYKGKKIPEIPQISFINESTQVFVSLVNSKEVLLFFDDRIQKYLYKGKLEKRKLTEYTLTVPSDDYIKSQFWYAPGLTVAPSFSFLEKKINIDLGEGEKVTRADYYKQFDEELAHLLDLYRNDAYFNAEEEYCHIVQACVNANNTSGVGVAQTAKDSFKNDCKGVLSMDELKALNAKTLKENEAVMKERKKRARQRREKIKSGK